MKTTLLIIAILSVGTLAAAPPPDKAKTSAEKVLDRLFAAAGNFTQTKPKLSIRNTANLVAAYNPKTNTLLLENKTLDICRSMGKDSLDALAFILGHEITHFFQHEKGKKGSPTNFLAYDRHINASLRSEKTADIQGAFLTYLAGFRVAGVVPGLIDKIYESYDLKGKTLSGYPPFDERQKTAADVMAQLDTLILVHETANYLTAAGEYDLSAFCSEYLLGYYQGRDIYNNMSVNFFLAAMNVGGKNLDDYAYPVELDWDTRLRKPPARGNLSELTPTERRLRELYLQSAKDYCLKAFKADPKYPLVFLNWLCILAAEGCPDEAIAFYKQNKLDKLLAKSKEGALAKLALAIAFAKHEQWPDAVKIFDELASNPNPSVALLVQHNKDIMMQKKTKTKPAEASDCCGTLKKTTPVDGVVLLKIVPPPSLWLNEEREAMLGFQVFKNSTVVQVSVGNSRSVTLQRIRQRPENSGWPGRTTDLPCPGNATIAAGSRLFIPCREKGFVCLANENGNLIEWTLFVVK